MILLGMKWRVLYQIVSGDLEGVGGGQEVDSIGLRSVEVLPGSLRSGSQKARASGRDVVGGGRHLATAAIREEKHTRAGAVLVSGHSGSPERLKFRLSGKPAQGKIAGTLFYGASVAVGYGVVK